MAEQLPIIWRSIHRAQKARAPSHRRSSLAALFRTLALSLFSSMALPESNPTHPPRPRCLPPVILRWPSSPHCKCCKGRFTRTKALDKKPFCVGHTHTQIKLEKVDVSLSR